MIRDSQTKMVKPVTTGSVYLAIHKLYVKAGLIQKGTAKRYDLRAHSIRKYFRTQLGSLSTIPTDYIEYIMGHTISTYHDIEMKGIEFLRSEYAKAGLSLKPKTETNKMAIVRELLKSMGLNPEEILSKEAQGMPHRTVITTNDLSEQDQVNLMMRALMQKIKQEIIAETQAKNQKTKKRYELLLNENSPGDRAPRP